MSDTHGQTALDTFPRLLMEHARQRPDRPAMREKAYGIWQTYSWAEVATSVRAIACGLAELGFKRGDRLAIIGDNRPRLYWSVAACQCLGGIPVMLYQDAVAQEMTYVLLDAEIRFAVVEDQEQVDKMLEILPEVPLLEHVIYDDPRGMRHYSQSQLMGLDGLHEMGRIHDRNQIDFLDGEIAKGASDDISVMLYTSGTTGKPKGVCQTHGAFIAAATGGVQFDRLTDREDILSYLPMAWVGDHLFSFAQAMVAGFTINCPESGETVMTDLREIGPTYYFAPPRVFENLLTQVMIRMEDAGAFKRKIFHHFMAVARRCGAEILDGKPVSAADRFQYWLGNLLVLGPLKNVLGMSRIRVAYTAGAAIGPDLFRFYRSIGVNLKQLYGQTETCAYVCLQPDGQIKLDSVGKPAPFVEVKLADNGEILVKGPMLLKAYYKRPDATAESINADGYFMTGDAGFFDDDGHLKIIDRAKDVGKLNDGSMFAPNFIENKLKFFQHIKEAVSFGNGRDFVTAFINIDIEAVGNWAERKGMAYAGYADLASQSAVYELIKEGIETVNADLASDPRMSGSQIKRFLILHKELDADDGELTRTRKVRRNFVAERYQVLIDGLYEGRKSQFIESEVKYEDGRTGKISANLRIEEAKTFTPRAAIQAA
ncbi:MAG: long-chain fatty acid--CoA ligase [Betaproteobacteria bacterium HGW-Betaproteobacteria-19]|nr:MAG: long-chain fatty acid--CoA ligase [Betaproteobacteria bacterium HGW-Betaproteobacteria-19]